jgi:hypothetical protein
MEVISAILLYMLETANQRPSDLTPQSSSSSHLIGVAGTVWQKDIP